MTNNQGTSASTTASTWQHLEGLQQNRDSKFWHQWAMRALLALGGGHFLAGVIFFFAYNWNDLPAFAKFGILQLAILASFAAGLLFRIERPGGQAMLIAASVFTGVLLAVIGQTYQTGADVWELFAAWTVLILPWALAARSSAHWFLWIIICLTAFSLYSNQVLFALGLFTAEELVAVVGVMPVLFLAVREAALRSGLDWLDDNWFRRALVVMSLGSLFFPALESVFNSSSTWIGFATFSAVSLVLAFVYAKLLPDFSVLAIVTAFATLMAMAIGGKLIDEAVDFDNSAGTLVTGLILLGGWCATLTTGTVKLLSYLHKQMNVGAGYE